MRHLRLETASVRDSGLFGGCTTIVSFLLLSGDFAAWRLLNVEPSALDRGLPRQVIESRLCDDQSECLAVR
jgi:hypothetical protein